MDKPQKFRLDKTAFKINSFKEADKAMQDYSNCTIKERLQIAYYLTSVAYRFDMKNPPRMDKTLFSIKKRES
jgi:hypothetical protein